MSQALYRKWRPAYFGQVVGQEHVTGTLQNAVAADRIGHAYLFSGPRGTGKTTIARLLAKAANCTHEDLAQRPCNSCSVCLAINENRFLDLIEIDAASNTGVDDIRDLRDKINFSPSEGRYKVYIIDEVHMLSTAAFNALLKTLEEPPPHAMFVLATTGEHKVPLTIKSRCQQFTFRLLTTREIIGRLEWLAEQEHLTIEPQALIMIAWHGAGSLRDAESLLDQLIVVPEDTITLDRAQMVLGTATAEVVSTLTDAWLAGDGPAGLQIIQAAFSSGTDARQFARQIVAYLRQLLLLKIGGRDLVLDLTADQKDKMVHQTTLADRHGLIQAIRHFNEAAATTIGSWQPNLPLELAFIELIPTSSKAPIFHDQVPEVADKPQPVPVQSGNAPPRSSPSVEVKETVNVSEKDVTEEETEKVKRADDAISLDMVAGKWSQLREHVGSKDKGLPALLASCKPLATEGNVLVLGFDYAILKDKFDMKQGAGNAVAEVLSQLLSTNCTVRTVLTETYKPPLRATTVNKEEFATLAEELGGVIRDD